MEVPLESNFNIRRECVIFVNNIFLGKPRHCRVSEWSDWTPCSASCDIGESTRSRTILKHSRRGGRPCPQLRERKWCGSARSCKEGMKDYFNWR